MGQPMMEITGVPIGTPAFGTTRHQCMVTIIIIVNNLHVVYFIP